MSELVELTPLNLCHKSKDKRGNLRGCGVVVVEWNKK